MESGIQLSAKVNGVLVNVYEPTMNVVKVTATMQELLDSIKSHYSDYKDDNGSMVVDEPFPSRKPTTAPLNASDGGFCKICGSKKDKWIPAGISKSTGKPYDGFFACPNKCKK